MYLQIFQYFSYILVTARTVTCRLENHSKPINVLKVFQQYVRTIYGCSCRNRRSGVVGVYARQMSGAYSNRHEKHINMVPTLVLVTTRVTQTSTLEPSGKN